MKCYILLFVFGIVSVGVNAQFSFGVQAGAGAATLHTNYIEKKCFDLTPSFHGGLYANYSLNRSFFVKGSLLYTKKGYRDIIRDGIIKYNDYYRVNYIGFTPQFFAKPRIKNSKLLIGFGPSIAYGLGGKWREKSLMSAIPSTKGKLIFVNDLIDGSNDITVGVYGKKWDFGGTLSLGYQFNNRIGVLLNSTGSILNIAPKINGKKLPYADRNFDINLSVQYRIR